VKAGELLFVGIEGPRLTAGERQLLRRVDPAGLVLFGRNVEDAEQLRALVAAIRLVKPDLILAVDSEGGRVDRLRAIVGGAPSAADLGSAPSVRSRRAGRWVGASLRAFGIDLDLAPVVDLDHERVDNALDGRCFGRTPRAVTARARGFLEGLESSGVGGCVKHFPGLGAAFEDTHRSGAVVALPRGRLARDLAPFVALADRTGAVLVSHAVYPALDPELRPASLSEAVSSTLLRRELRFRGCLLSDDLEMGALAAVGDLPDVGEAALAAGCDGLLFCRRLEETPTIAARIVRRRSLDGRVRQAKGRLAALRRRLAKLRRAAPEPPDLDKLRRQLAGLA